MIELDRRDFLKLAAAAGLTAAGSSWLSAPVFGQSQSPSASGDPAATADPIADLAASLGHDLERIFSFVRDDITYEPYAGILRGAKGTLLARAGNSADQAVLLAQLLKASSFGVRYAIGAIDDRMAATLLASSVTDSARAREEIDRSWGSSPWRGDAAVVGSGAPPPVPLDADMTAMAEAVRADLVAAVGVARQQTTGTMDTILTALASEGIALPTQVTDMPPLERSGHTWVQVAQGSTWLDLDPTLPANHTGAALAEQLLEALPDELRHLVGFAVVVESLTGESLRQATLLERTEFADELVGVGVAFGHVRAGELKDVEIIRRGLGSGVEYNAILSVGDRSFVGTTTIALGGTGDDIFGGALGGGAPGIIEGEASAEWLHVRVTSPGAAPAVARRQVFDRIGDAIRSSGFIDPYAVAPAELVEPYPGADAEFSPCRRVYAFSISGGPVDLEALLIGLDPNSPTALCSVAHGYHALRDALSADLALEAGQRPFVDAPNVVACVLSETTDRLVIGLDLWHRSLGSRSLSDRTPTLPPALFNSVVSHVAERIALGDGLPSGGLEPVARASVGSLFDVSKAAGVRIRAVRGSVPPDLPLGPDQVAAAQAALDAGLVIIVPEAATVVAGVPRIGWWQVDPVSGRATDRMDDGSGQDDTEVTIIEPTKQPRWFKVLACFVAILPILASFIKEFLDREGKIIVGAGLLGYSLAFFFKFEYAAILLAACRSLFR